MLKNIKHKISPKRIWASLGLIGLVLITTSSPISAQTVTQGYSNDVVLQRGTVVSLDAEDSTKVVAANRDNQARVHGVVIAANDSPFTLSNDTEKTFVATVGRFDTLVSTEDGTVQPGDFLTISSIAGIATKAGEDDAYSVGKAIEGFDGEENSITTTSVTDSNGNQRQVKIGRVLVDVSVGSNPLLKPAEANLPGFLQKATEIIAGKEVSPIRVYIGSFILLAAASISGSLLYSGIKSSLISIGRNPLSKKSITKSLVQVILTSIIIFLIGLFGVYLLLRL